MRQEYSAGVVPYRLREGKLEYLLVQHTHGHWEFPKGKIDPGETIRQAALRELVEETGVTATLHDGFEDTMAYQYSNKRGQRIYKQVHFFVGLVGSGEVRISHEHADITWLGYEDAWQQLTHIESRDLITKANAFVRATQRG